MDRSSGSYRGDDGGLYKGGELGSGLHMMGQKEKEVSRMTPRFLSCNTVWLVLFSEFRSTERTRFGEKNRMPLCSVVPRSVVQHGSPREDHRFSFRQVKFEVSLRHPNDISKEAAGNAKKPGLETRG